jgi:hypothetical protein
MQASWNDFDEKATAGVFELIRGTGKTFNEQVRRYIILQFCAFVELILVLLESCQ